MGDAISTPKAELKRAIESQATSIRSRLEVVRTSVDDVLPFDLDNAYPQRCLRFTRSSGTASNCVRQYGKAINGKGWSEEILREYLVNRKKEKLSSILRKVSNDIANHNGFSLHFNFNIFGKITEVNYIPFRDCRLGLPDDLGYISKIAVSKEWERKSKYERKCKPKFFPVYNPDPEIVQSQIAEAKGIENYPGQILWFSMSDDCYPLAPYDPVLEDILTDAEIKVFKFKNITTNFMASTIITTIGDFEDDDEEDEFDANLNQFQGAKNAGRILRIKADDKEQAPVITPLTTQSKDKEYEYTEKSVKEQIVECFNVPPVLVGIRSNSGLNASSGEEIMAAKKHYDDITQDERELVASIFKSIFNNWFQIITVKEWLIIPITGLVVEQKKTPLAVSLGVGGTEAIVKTITDPILSQDPEKLKAVLIEIFGVDEDAAIKLTTSKGTPAPPSLAEPPINEPPK